MKQSAPQNIDDYIAGFPNHVREILENIRLTIARTAPTAEEAIKYQIPAFTLDGNLVFFAAYKNHIGIYPIPKGTKTFQKQISRYKIGKGTIRLPLDKPIPFALIRNLVSFRIAENVAQSAVRKVK